MTSCRASLYNEWLGLLYFQKKRASPVNMATLASTHELLECQHHLVSNTVPTDQHGAIVADALDIRIFGTIAFNVDAVHLMRSRALCGGIQSGIQSTACWGDTSCMKAMAMAFLPCMHEGGSMHTHA